MRKILRYVGLDVHKDSVTIAVAERGRGAAQVFKVVPNERLAILKALDSLGGPSRLSLCYEAGPTGFELARSLMDSNYLCQVVAPSLIPVKSGDRVKTDRRDAVKLAHFHRSGDLTSVHIPDAQTEAMRDLERAREDAKNAERVTRHQLDKFLLRHGRRWSGKSKWTQAHLAWIREQAFPEVALRRVHADYLLAVEVSTDRVERLTKDIEELVEEWALAPLVKGLMALRGVALVTAVTLAAEVGDYSRFANARQLMAYIGLVSSENSSGTRRRQGRITRTGNGRVRRLLVESAWHYRFRPTTSKAIKARQQCVTAPIRAIALKAQTRLHRRYEYLTTKKGKPAQVAVTAVARELLGFIWAISRQDKFLADPPTSAAAKKKPSRGGARKTKPAGAAVEVAIP